MLKDRHRQSPCYLAGDDEFARDDEEEGEYGENDWEDESAGGHSSLFQKVIPEVTHLASHLLSCTGTSEAASPRKTEPEKETDVLNVSVRAGSLRLMQDVV